MRDARVVLGGATALLEREDELRALRADIDRARSGNGRAVLIEAPAGLGKTRLLLEACDRARDEGFRVVLARGGELERHFSWGIVRGLFERAVAAGGDAGAFAGAARHARGLLAGDLLDQPSTAADVTLHGLYWLVANLSERRPLVLAVDDAHWSDSASLAFLTYLGRRLDGLRVVLLVAARPHEPVDPGLIALGFERSGRILRPAPLQDRAIAALVGERFAAPPDPDFVRACRQATGGNPFLLTVLLDGLVTLGLPPTAASLRRAGAAGAQEIVGWLLSRLSLRGTGGAALARAAAVLGSDAALQRAAAVAGVGETTAVALVDELVRAGFLEPRVTLTFVHPLIRSAIYDAIPPGERSRLHARAADLLAADGGRADRIGAHLLATLPSGNPAAVARLRQAASAAVASGDPATAARFLERALAEPPAPELRGDVLFELGSAEAAASHPDSVAHLREAVELAGDPLVRARRTLVLAPAQVWAGRGLEAVDALRDAIDRVGPAQPEQAARLEATLFLSSTEQGLLRVARARLDKVRRREQELGADPASRTLAGSLAWFAGLLGEDADEVAALADRALAGGRLLREHDPGSLFVLTTLQAVSFADRLERAHELWSQAIDIARRAGSVSSYAINSTFRAHTALRLGRLTEAAADASAALEIARAETLGIVRDHAAAFLGWTLVASGDVAGAERVLPADAGGAASAGRDIFVPFVRGLVAAARGHHAAAATHLLEAGASAAPWSSNPAILAWRSQAALSLAACGEHARASELAREELELARRLGSDAAIGIALRACGRVERGGADLELLADAVAALERSEARLEHAHALIDLGVALLHADRRDDAREPLARGLDLATRCGARALAAHAGEQLRAAGARPRSPYRTGRDALTPSELRVAELAAEGMSNRDIAQALFVTTKTVELHLSHAYRKLQISSRRALSAALARTSPGTAAF